MAGFPYLHARPVICKRQIDAEAFWKVSGEAHFPLKRTCYVLFTVNPSTMSSLVAIKENTMAF